MDIGQFILHSRLEDDHWWFKARRLIILDMLQRFVPPGRDRLVVEIGCGTGGNLKFLQSHYRVMGCDLSPHAVAYARQRVSCPVFLGDFADHLEPFWPETAAVLLPDVLEHIPDDAAFLERIVASLRPGGIILLTVPAHRFLWSRHDEVLGHVRRYSADTLRTLWAGLPVEPLLITPFNGFLFPLMVLYRKLGFGGKREGESNLKMPHPLINHMLFHVFVAERFLLRLMSLPFGASYCVVLRKSSYSV